MPGQQLHITQGATSAVHGTSCTGDERSASGIRRTSLETNFLEVGGAAMMKTILLANPDIDVVLGADTVVLGALAALRAAGTARPGQMIGWQG
jgi:ABC-type sugar transport system substrate-binding protein